MNVISNTFGDHGIGYQRNDNCTFNPLDKMVELYERMLQQQKEMIDRLERLIKKKLYTNSGYNIQTVKSR